MDNFNFDCIVIGIGPAGLACATALARAGRKVATVEYDSFGGTCLNRGCIPTTLLLNIAEFIKRLKSSDSIGIELNSGYSTNFRKIVEYKNSVINIHRKGIAQLLNSLKIMHYQGIASFVDRHSVSVELAAGNTVILTAADIVIATGTKPLLPEMFAAQPDYFLTSENIMDIQQPPSKLAIVGAGVTG